jgi:hypothetical protein
MYLDYLQCPYKKDKSIPDAKTYLTQGMSRLELSKIAVEKWGRYLLANMNEADRLWTELNVDLEHAQRATTKEKFTDRFANPFLDADNGYVTARLNLTEYHGYTWETSKLPYPAFIKALGTLAVKAGISDGAASSIILFIEKQPEEVKIGLHNLAVQKGPHSSLRLCCQDASFLLSAYETFQQPDPERRMEQNSHPFSKPSLVSRTAPTPMDRKNERWALSFVQRKRIERHVDTSSLGHSASGVFAQHPGKERTLAISHSSRRIIFVLDPISRLNLC